MSGLLDQTIRKNLFVLDGLLVLIAILMRTTDSIVFLFHLVFVLLAIGAFYWNFRSFVIHSTFWVSVTALEVYIAVLDGQTQFEELIEIPLLCTILLTVFLIASQRANAQEALEREHRALEKTLTERDELQKALEEKAFFDPLTKLPNRALLFDRLKASCSQAARNRQNVAVMFLDLDGFKEVNDRFGHAVGDALLVAVAERFKNPIREIDTLSRLGGDEFIIVLSGGISDRDVKEIAERLIDEVSQPFQIGENNVEISTSIGIIIRPPDSIDVEELIKNADTALYKAKQSGKSTYSIYTH